MWNLIAQADIFSGNGWIPPIASLVAFAAILTITWNISRKITTLELLVSTVEKRHNNDILNLENKLTEVDKQGEVKLTESKVDITAQLSNIRSQLKDVDNRVTIVDTKVKNHDEQIVNLHQRIDKNIDFFTIWTQRVEDRVEKSQDRAVQMVRDAIHEVMGQMNMLINLSRSRSR